MTTQAPSSLDSRVHLDEFDRRRARFHHVRPPSRGGTSTISNLRCLCRAYNMLHAEEIYGREFMDRFRRGARTIAGGSAGTQG